jgi:Asp/Glu/hydantoin racemase
MRLALIHALRHSPPPIEAAFAQLWPGQTLMNLLDDSLSADLAREGKLTPRMTERFLTLARYAAGTGADGILFTCSAFGPCIEACAQDLAPMPVLKPNEAMIEEAITKGKRIGLLVTFAGTIPSMIPEFPPGITVVPKLAEGLAAEAARDLADCDAIALGQFSLARAKSLVEQATGKPVLTTPDSAVLKLKRLLGG